MIQASVFIFSDPAKFMFTWSVEHINISRENCRAPYDNMKCFNTAPKSWAIEGCKYHMNKTQLREHSASY